MPAELARLPSAGRPVEAALGDVPDAVLLNIFDLLSASDLLSISQVSTAFESAAVPLLGARGIPALKPLMHPNVASVAAVRVLLEAGLPADTMNAEGVTALQAAARGGSLGAVRVLLRAGASAFAAAAGGETAWHHAVAAPDLWDLMVREGADAAVGPPTLRTSPPGAFPPIPGSLLHLAVERGSSMQLATLLAAGRQDVDFQAGPEAPTALQLAAALGKVAAVRQLLDSGADLELGQRRGGTALARAARHGRAGAAAVLVAAGARLDATDGQRLTVVHLAAQCDGGEATLAVLLAAGAPPSRRDAAGQTALHAAAKAGREAVVELLLEFGSNTKLQDKTGCTALHLAVRAGSLGAAQALLQAGAPPDARNAARETALHIACSSYGFDHLAMARLLLRHNASPNLYDDGSLRALDLAQRRGNADTVRVLLQGGADPDAQDCFGHTALSEACKKGQLDIVQVLLAAGASLAATSSCGTPLQLATGKGHHAVAEALRRAGAVQ